MVYEDHPACACTLDGFESIARTVARLFARHHDVVCSAEHCLLLVSKGVTGGSVQQSIRHHDVGVQQEAPAQPEEPPSCHALLHR